MFVGVDLASVNAGYALISDSFDIKFSLKLVTPDEFKVSDVTKCTFQADYFSKFLSQVPSTKALGIEAPALSAKFQMASIGFIHGAITARAMEFKKPWVYTPPTKIRYALLGAGNADKSLGVSFVKEHFTYKGSNQFPKSFEHNQADAVLLAYFSYLLYCFLHSITPKYLGNIEKKVQEAFYSTKVSSKKPDGIMHRKNEFYFTF